MPDSKLQFILPQWPTPASIHACTTTRAGGFSKGQWASLNLATHVDDDYQAVQANRDLLATSLQLPGEPAWLQQVHGCDVFITDAFDSTPVADASFSDRPGIVCAVLTADCLPILLCSSDGEQVAAIHAGWRGLAAGVIESTVARFTVDSMKLIAWLGPAIGPMAFEVGDEVRQAFIQYQPEAKIAFQSHGDKWLCDIYQLARLRLQAIGVVEVYGGGLCTYTDSERFYSYRRDNVTGRMASLIWIK